MPFMQNNSLFYWCFPLIICSLVVFVFRLITNHTSEDEKVHLFCSVVSMDNSIDLLNILKVLIRFSVQLLYVVCNFLYSAMITQVRFFICKRVYKMLRWQQFIGISVNQKAFFEFRYHKKQTVQSMLFLHLRLVSTLVMRLCKNSIYYTFEFTTYYCSLFQNVAPSLFKSSYATVYRSLHIHYFVFVSCTYLYCLRYSYMFHSVTSDLYLFFCLYLFACYLDWILLVSI